MIFQLVDSEDKVVDTIAAHKVILAVHNEYFRAIFFGTGAFFKEGKDGIVVVKETTKEAFLDLLGFIYEKDINPALPGGQVEGRGEQVHQQLPYHHGQRGHGCKYCSGPFQHL